MAGRKRLDLIAAQIAAHHARQGGDVLAAVLRRLPDETLQHMQTRLEAGEDPAKVLKEILRQ